MLDLKGIIPALVSPKDEDGNLDVGPIGRIIDFDIERGITGVFVGGSTGEGFCQTVQESKQLAEAVIESVSGRIPVVIHVGSMNHREVMELSEHAAGAGADGVSSVIPFYYSYTLEEIRNFYQSISDASGLPTLIYALSQVATSNFPPDEFIDAALSVKGVYGIKFTNNDVYRLNILKQLAQGKLRFYGGVDVIPLPMLCMGADGLIGSNYSALPEPWVGIYSAYLEGDLGKAIAMQERIVHYVRTFGHVGGGQRAKYVLELRGIAAGDVWLPKGPKKESDMDVCKMVLEELKTDSVFKGIMKW